MTRLSSPSLSPPARPDRVGGRHPRLGAAARVGVVVLAVAAVSACGQPPAAMTAGAPAGSAAPPGSGPAPAADEAPAAPPDAPAAPTPTPTPAGPPTLPTLPPLRHGQSASFDDNGCLVGPAVPGTPVACTTTAEQLDAQRAGSTADDWRDLAGFSGRLYTTQLGGGAAVLPASVLTGPTATGRWGAQGLARNETTAVIPALTVTAELVGADGAVLERVTGHALVAGVRPGEPVPFALSATATDAAAVRSVQWSVGSDAAALVAPSRHLQIVTYWTRPSGGEPMESALHRDQGTPDSHLVYGSVTNVGAALGGVTVVGAWLDRQGRVVAVASGPGLAGPGDEATEISPGGFADWLLTVDDPTGAALGDLTPMLWAVAR